MRMFLPSGFRKGSFMSGFGGKKKNNQGEMGITFLLLLFP